MRRVGGSGHGPTERARRGGGGHGRGGAGTGGGGGGGRGRERAGGGGAGTGRERSGGGGAFGADGGVVGVELAGAVFDLGAQAGVAAGRFLDFGPVGSPLV